ncbi:MAG: hypothetical protein A2750_01950 [Candidatus Yanofskybacteria bacterium RIFCSPHIGHO2_01_FULL_45_42]|uniref:Uncharacterized protein n=3 Tax=Candidatus Yanofskyibacteriota TaxID=1752733 RepID=A0A1F8H3Q3_9BACT|nr:MAG: hypothetical protein A2750_01950 [Candidatus Yanofskybacteria bacterium RIFCSPHIGHO2_01_FULL_45_42]OGN15577.1 MAG: hypothetical protein A3C81_00335 [Candidatus Yanofskybacteria bacterium RIFCSPHIGHO2_02_FULL_46_19]OGN27901.1 MAG: hypothetical protein A3B17_01850 [Candidatus Yanofskybacteria bacterium RIFCSPLOWO2_01_FULL_45_72]OGN32213.1 MAG: hypothetical protein A3J01_01325 [Candidatus Yanofskybacteria bacterium RIFCSPLOWO2_02_FULL_45_18]
MQVISQGSHFEVRYRVTSESHKDNTPLKKDGEEPLVNGGVLMEHRALLEIRPGEVPATAFERLKKNLTDSSVRIYGTLRLVEVIRVEVLRAESDLNSKNDDTNSDPVEKTIWHYHQR